MWRAIEVAQAANEPLMLIGDPEYYAQFGFDAEATGQWRLPGPFEQRRLLARDLADELGATCFEQAQLGRTGLGDVRLQCIDLGLVQGLGAGVGTQAQAVAGRTGTA